MEKMSIDELKSGAKTNEDQKTEEKTNTPSGKNINGQELRTFEGGLKEMDPLANGFVTEKEGYEGSSDIQNALNGFEKVVKEKKEAAKKYNELLDQYGGAISEEDLRREMGQDYITKRLKDGKGGQYEEEPGKMAAVDDKGNAIDESIEDDVPVPTPENVSAEKESSELDELEKELEEDLDSSRVIPMPSVISPAKEKEVLPVETIVPAEEEVSDKADPAVKQAKDTLVEAKEAPSSEKNVLAGELYIPDRKDFSGEISGIQEDKDMAELEEENLAPPVDDFAEKLKAELEKKMKPVSKKFDLSHVTISKEPITVNNALNKFVPADRKSFTWPLIQTRVPLTMRSFTATELEHLSEIANDNRNREIFQTIYEHVIEPKAKSFEIWCKCVSYFDVDHIWFAIYCACFADSNYLPFTCNSCRQLTVTTDIPIKDMVTFKDDETKALHEKIRTSPPDPAMTNKFAEYLLQVSDTLVFGFREPSIYDAIIAPTLYDSEFVSKYQDIIGLSAYVSGIYSINYETNQLDPIATKIFPNNESKTMKAKIIQYSKIVRSLTSDQYNIILRHIGTMTNQNLVSYSLPSATCDHCKKEIPGTKMAAYDLVFTRHRLGLLGA